MGKKRRFPEIQHLILSSFENNPKFRQEISNETGLYFSTVNLHLTYLKGLGLVREFSPHHTLMLYEITEEGLDFLKHMQRHNGTKKD